MNSKSNHICNWAFFFKPGSLGFSFLCSSSDPLRSAEDVFVDGPEADLEKVEGGGEDVGLIEELEPDLRPGELPLHDLLLLDALDR